MEKQKPKERECEDCKETMRSNERRVRCKLCNQLVCGWCIHHVHNVHVQARIGDIAKQ